MNGKTALCGLNCLACPAYIATQENDNEKREGTAAQWTEMFGREVTPEEINCDGCTSDTGRLFTHCTTCEIRACAMEKKVENCAFCPDYECEKLTSFFEMAPEARDNLERIIAT